MEGNTYDDGIPTYNESEFAEADQLGGIVQDGIRILKDKESVIYQIEVDPNAEFLKLDMWETALPEGESSYSQMFDIALYSSEAEEFKAIVDYGNNIPGGLTQEYFQWKYFDNTWGRSDTNKYIVTNDAPINPETGKKDAHPALYGAGSRAIRAPTTMRASCSSRALSCRPSCR